MKLFIQLIIAVTLLSACSKKSDPIKAVAVPKTGSGNSETAPAETTKPIETKPAPPVAPTPAVVTPAMPTVTSPAQTAGQTTAPTEPTITPPGQTTAPVADQEKEGVDFVFLDKKDVQMLGEVVNYYFGSSSADVLAVSTGGPLVKKSSFNGKLDAAKFNILLEDNTQLETPVLKMVLNNFSEAKIDKYELRTFCIGSDCRLVFATIYIRAEGRFVFNRPLVFKKIADEKYLPAFMKNGVDYSVEPGSEKPDENPPQFRVMQKLEQKTEQHWEKARSIIKEKMDKNNSIYSGLFVEGLSSPTILTDFNKSEKEFSVKVSATFHEMAARKSFSFSSNIDGNKPLMVEHKDSKTTMDVIQIDGIELMLVILEQDDFKTAIPNVNKGTFALLCSLLVEAKTTFHECQMLPSSSFLGVIALEGKIGGPVLESPGHILDKVP